MPAPRGKFEFTAKDATKAAFGSIGKSLKAVTGSVFSLKTALVGVVGIGGFGALIKSQLKTIDTLGKTADKLGLSTEALAKFQLTADITGVSANTLTKSIQKMVVNLNDAANDTGEARDAFAALGVETKSLVALSPDKQFAVIADAMKNVETSTEKLSIAYDIFGGRGTDLINTLALGREGLESIGAEAEIFGLTMSRDTVKGVEKANDEIVRLFALGKGLARQFTAAIAPALEMVTTGFKDYLVELVKSEGGMKKFSQTLATKVFNGFIAALEGAKKLIEGIDFLIEKGKELGIFSRTEAEKQMQRDKQDLAIIDEKLAVIDKESIGFAALTFRRTELSKVIQDSQKEEVSGIQIIIDKTKELRDELIKKNAAAVVPEPETGGNGGGNGTGEDATLAKSTEKFNTFLQNKVASFSASLLTEEERLTESLERRQFMVEDAFQELLISEERKNQLLLSLEEKHAADVKRIEKDKAKAKKQLQLQVLSDASSITGSLTTLVGSSSRKQFETGKKLARAGVLIDTAAGISKVIGQGGFAGFVAVAAVVAAGAASLAQINRTQFGGGGGISSGGVNFPSPTAGQPPAALAPQQPNIQQQAAIPNINITIQGNVLGNEEFVRDTLIPIISDEINNGDSVIINQNSQQAFELSA